MNDERHIRAESLAVRNALIDQLEAERRQHALRQAWINAVLEAWDEGKYPTLGEFMASPEGRKFAE
jgi:hypothetical protein